MYLPWTASADELATLVQNAEAKAPEDLTEEDKMALLGRPKAGDVVRAQMRIKESKEFKVSYNYKSPFDVRLVDWISKGNVIQISGCFLE